MTPTGAKGGEGKREVIQQLINVEKGKGKLRRSPNMERGKSSKGSKLCGLQLRQGVNARNSKQMWGNVTTKDENSLCSGAGERKKKSARKNGSTVKGRIILQKLYLDSIVDHWMGDAKFQGEEGVGFKQPKGLSTPEAKKFFGIQIGEKEGTPIRT